MAGYVAVILLLGAALVFAVHRFARVAASQIAEIRVQEHAITSAQRLRWNAELGVAAGRGYLVTAEPQFLAKIGEAEVDFARELRALRGANLTPVGESLLGEVERAAADYANAQADVLAARRQSEDSGRLIRLFENELQPRRRALTATLERFVEHKNARIRESYEHAEAERARLVTHTWMLLAALVGLAFGLSWLFATQLTRAHRRVEDALQVSRKAVSARDEIMAMVAHDLRNPLGAITMQAAMLRQGGEAQAVQRRAESIESVAMRMEYLIKSMLDVATIDAGGFTVSPEQLAVSDLVRETSDMFHALAVSKSITLEHSVAPPDLVVWADRERILQVLSNLLGNAFKFTPPGGRIEVSIARLDHVVRFSVADSGAGIGREQLPYIFDRFWKHEAHGQKGTGLGLFISKGIVEVHGGRIWADSEPGCGSTFVFELPDGSGRGGRVDHR
jgi:signal transduction histidine kinase